MVGRVISHYRVIEKLGEGGMGEVYKAVDLTLDRPVALKVLRVSKIIDDKRKRRFVFEAKAASALNHPNIVTIHEITSQDGVYFIVMEHVAGRTLDNLISRKGLKPGDALNVAIQVADAMSSAHAAGIIHRDLKPSNIMVREDGRVKVLDFGLAKLTEIEKNGEDEATRTLAQTADSPEGIIVGTTPYMSPEQAQGIKLGPRSDIFSFGAVLYEMLTGERPFQRESTVSTLAAILTDEPKPLAASAPRELGRILARCLRKDPNRRFQTMADLRVALEDLKEESQSRPIELHAEPSVRSRSSRAKWVAATVLLSGLAAAVYWRNSAGAGPAASVVPLTSYAGDELHPVFSPDGNQIAFSWNGDKKDNYDIWVKLIDSPTPLRLTHDPLPESNPAWSPDGRSIAFVRQLSSGGGLPIALVMVIPSIGGSEREVAEIRSGIWPGTDWSRDGKWLAISDASDGQRTCIYLANVETRERRRLTCPLPEGVMGDSSPAFSSDGKQLAFVRAFANTTSQIYLLELSEQLAPKGEPKPLTHEARVNFGPVWTADGKEIVYSSAVSQRSSLWRISTSGSARPKLLAFGENGSFPALSKDAHRLAFQRDTNDVNIWRSDLTKPRGSNAAPLIASTRLDSNPQYSPDGKQLAFVSDRSGDMEIWTANDDGSNPVQVTHLRGANAGTPRWSPDGLRIAFDWNVSGHFDVYTTSVDGGSPQRITDAAADSNIPSYSHNGRWIYFSSRRSGRPEIWKAPAGGGAAVQVTHNGGHVAMESADGMRLYYTRSESANFSAPLWMAPVEGGEEKQVIDAVYRRAFFPVKDGIYFLNPPDDQGVASVSLLSFTDSKIRQVSRLAAPPHWGLSVSPDGRFAVYCEFDQLGSDLMLVENFR